MKLFTSIRNGFLSEDDTTSTFIVLLELVPKQLVALIVKENDNSFTEFPDITPFSNVSPVGNIELIHGVPAETVPSPLVIMGVEFAQTTML